MSDLEKRVGWDQALARYFFTGKSDNCEEKDRYKEFVCTCEICIKWLLKY